ncbi:Acyl-ACP thioesterase [uncultured Ruminococcus sp.]|uniref:Acyl-ACP thioesterase n=1 Tax=Massiliimalia timonensis TaxID=1987501 RepID=A0A8J6PGQ0_9FIRM|nr:acyl-ACP thioesterase domain-containing protein [Massiliimalia timonensis]MBC8609965.1 hypothetical protein [Massiliimalia timonensis]SCH16804.1 Acyl-ACP thioesterase [uncultured Ruminococcus sp.]SCH23364.1 Acyl-ACP thioesterase [uncultured Clostridium sp.]
MIQHYEKEIAVNQFECDFQNRMKAGSLMRQVEQVSMDNCTAIGVDAALYDRTHTAFLLAKLSLIFYRDITVGELLKLDTTAALPVRAVYNRYTSVLDQNGNEAAGIDTRWVLVDTQSRRILRRPPEEFQLPFVDKTAKELDFSIEAVPETESVGIVCAEYSRVDINRHLNNAEYADLILNHLPLEELEHTSVERLVIYYHNELPMGETMELFRAKTTQNSYYFYGIRQDEKKCFEAQVTLK